MVTAPKLEVRNVSKQFGPDGSRGVPVLVDLSFSVRELEFVAVLGPSGCGKSTFLRIVSGLVDPDEGSILIDGKEVKGPGHGRAMVFQGFDLFPWRSTLDNVAFGLEMLNMPAAERRRVAQHYVKLVGLSGFEQSYPFQLSGGMQQRVGLARALAIKPSVLLMDEPFGALDVQTRDLLQDEVLRIWQNERKTVIFVTHSIEEAIYLADRTVIFSPRPAHIERIVDVPFPRPRTEELKTSVPFMEMRREIWSMLKQHVTI
jgi:NitT/TauT family transport system ATP-binding protein